MIGHGFEQGLISLWDLSTGSGCSRFTLSQRLHAAGITPIVEIKDNHPLSPGSLYSPSDFVKYVNTFWHDAAKCTSRRGRTKAADSKAGSPGVIYIIGSDTGLYKIGFTTSLINRLALFNSTCPGKLWVEHIILADKHMRAEAIIHHEFRSKCVKAEWFALDAEDLKMIKRVKRIK